MLRLSDKNIEAILEDSRQCRAPGMGDVQLLCAEIQERRGKQAQEPGALKPLDSNERLLDWLIARVDAKEPMPDGRVLALFHALQRQGYFQTITFVNRKALETVVHALACTEHPHIVRELQVTRNLPVAEGEPLNPINQLIQDARNAPAQPD